VLHFAPEQAFYKRFRKLKHLDYTTTDLNSPLADVKADICNLPFGENQYDIIFCNHVLEHIPDDTKAMQELYRVLKPGGQYDHVRVYGRDYFDKLRSIGFTVDEVDYTTILSPEEVDLYRLAQGEILPVCRK